MPSAHVMAPPLGGLGSALAEGRARKARPGFSAAARGYQKKKGYEQGKGKSRDRRQKARRSESPTVWERKKSCNRDDIPICVNVTHFGYLEI